MVSVNNIYSYSYMNTCSNSMSCLLVLYWDRYDSLFFHSIVFPSCVLCPVSYLFVLCVVRGAWWCVAGGGTAVDQGNSNLTFVRNFFTNNSAPAGGGLFVADGNVGVTFIENHIFQNRAFLDGGGLCSYDSNRVLSFEGDVFEDNVCFYRGGGAYDDLVICCFVVCCIVVLLCCCCIWWCIVW